MTLCIRFALIVMSAIGAVRLDAQSQTDQVPAFEVASVKRNISGEQSTNLRLEPSGGFTATNVPLRELIRAAYGLQDYQIVGGPPWIASDRFDVVAKAEGPVTRGRINLMVQSLLADRFGLRTRRETRSVPIYALVMAREGGAFGPSLRRAAIDCAAIAAASRARGVAPAPPPPAGEPIQCGTRSGRGSVAAGGISMTQLAGTLSRFTDRLVVDRTALNGEFDLELRWAPDTGASPRPDLADLPSIVTAVQEHLGLRLEPSTGPVDALVIDAIQAPTPD